MPVDKRSSRKLWMLLFGLMFITAGCAISQSPPITKIALLAPFEGRDRAIGYNALYAVRLALTESGTRHIQLLAVDDGGTVIRAMERIRGLNTDPSVYAIIALGENATSHEAQTINDKPLIILGYWNHPVADDDSYLTSNPEFIDQVTDASGDATLSAEMLIRQLDRLTSEATEQGILSTSLLPDEAFTERYINSDLYVPEPNLLATLTYDIANLIIESITTQVPIAEITYSGINGDIHFEDGYWKDAVVHSYSYRNGSWVEISP